MWCLCWFILCKRLGVWLFLIFLWVLCCDLVWGGYVVVFWWFGCGWLVLIVLWCCDCVVIGVVVFISCWIWCVLCIVWRLGWLFLNWGKIRVFVWCWFFVCECMWWWVVLGLLWWWIVMGDVCDCYCVLYCILVMGLGWLMLCLLFFVLLIDVVNDF